jgi:uncharacterized protein (TIGR03435 family)
MQKKHLAGIVLAFLAQVAAARGPDLDRFEAASIRQHRSGQSGQAIRVGHGDRVVITNVPLSIIIRDAFRLGPDDLLGAPQWVNSTRFDVTAKSEVPTPPDRLRLMLRNLLTSHFKLVVHQEDRDATGYAMVLARRDGRLGERLKRSSIDCTTQTIQNAPPPPPGRGRGAVPDSAPCAMRSGIGFIAAQGLPLERLANLLSVPTAAGGRVVDETGLAGLFDWALQFTPAQFQAGFDRERFPLIDPDGPSVFTAVQEQLGLTLQPKKGTRMVIVIDSIEMPKEPPAPVNPLNP